MDKRDGTASIMSLHYELIRSTTKNYFYLKRSEGMYLQANQSSGTVLRNVTAESAVIGSTKHNNCCYDFQTSITNILWHK